MTTQERIDRLLKDNNMLRASIKQNSIFCNELQEQLEATEKSLASQRDLFFAMCMTFGPKITLHIENFPETMKNAEFDGIISLLDNGLFSAEIELHINGKPQQETTN
jgi:hypothetical protein